MCQSGELPVRDVGATASHLIADDADASARASAVHGPGAKPRNRSGNSPLFRTLAPWFNGGDG